MNFSKTRKIIEIALLQQIRKQKLSTSSEQYVDVSFKDGIKQIKMCHTKTRNSLSINMMNELLDNVTRGQNDPQLRVIILSAVGPVFSAGHNLKELAPEVGRKQQEHVFSLSSKLMTSIIDSPVPVIAKVDGLAAAAGCQLVAQCDLAVCTEKSTFSTPGANFGIFCSTPGVAIGRSLQKNMAMQMLLTGQPITSQEAKEAGLVNKICTPETFDFEVDKMCQAIMQKSRSVIELGKIFFYKQIQTDIRKAYAMGEKVMVDNLNMDDGIEGVRSFAEKRKPKWHN